MNVNPTPQFRSDCETPIGRLTITANDGGLTGLFFPGRAPEQRGPDRHCEALRAAVRQLEEYFTGARTQFDLNLDLSLGTPFQRAVWAELMRIPYGETVSYGQLATRLGGFDRVRAVGAAVGRTPVPIIVPCHRVVGADGSLTGYLGGLQRKRALLELEAAVSRGHGAPRNVGPRQLALL